MNYSELRRAPVPVKALAAHTLLAKLVQTHMVAFALIETPAGALKVGIVTTPYSAADDDDSQDEAFSGESVADALIIAAEFFNVPCPFRDLSEHGHEHPQETSH